MAFYKPADDATQMLYSSNPLELASDIKEKLIEANREFRFQPANPPFFDDNSIDVRIDNAMKSAYVFMRNRRGEAFFGQFDFSEPMDFTYVNHSGMTINTIDRVLAINGFFEAAKESAEFNIWSMKNTLEERLNIYLYSVKGKLSFEGSGSIIRGDLNYDDEFTVSVKLCLKYVGEEEHKSLISRGVSGDNSKSAASIDVMDGHKFELFCAELLRNNGFSEVEVTPGSGDQGIDVLATKDFIKYGFQCKRYSSDVGNKAVQEALAGKSYYKCHVAVVITNRYFTPAAKALAEQTGVVLWDRDQLESMAPGKLGGSASGGVAVVGDELQEQIDNAVDVFNSISNILSSLNDAGPYGPLFGIDNEPLLKAFKAQILSFLYWVIDAGDGVSDLDAHIVSAFYGEKMPVKIIEEFIDEGFVPEDFPYRPPSVMGAMAQLMARNEVGNPEEVILPFYKHLGQILYLATDQWKEERLDRITSYMLLLQAMIENES